MAQSSGSTNHRTLSDRSVFLLIGCLTFLLYLPAIKAGWVIDAAGWLAHVKDKQETLIPYLNRTWSTVPGLYQFTQLITLAFYKIWGANVYAWSLLYELMHTLNAWLFFLVASRILTDTGYDARKARRVSLIAVLLFTISPHISEVLIWKACYHYLQGFLMILLCMYSFLAFQHTAKARYALLSGIVFLLSIFTLEFFYLTPLFLSALALYYSRLPAFKSVSLKKSLGYFVVPQLAILGLYLWLFHHLYPGAKPHVYNLVSQSFTDYFSKGPKYMFHILFLGRYYPFSFRQTIYHFCESAYGLAMFYGLVVWLFFRTWKRSLIGIPFYKVVLLFLLFACLSIALLFPLAFPSEPLLVFFDRYTYVALPFIYLLLTLWLLRSPKKVLAGLVLILFAGANLYRTIQLNLLWKHSNFVVHRLITEIPDPGKRTVLLLNVPDNMNGAAMIGANADGAWKMLREVVLNEKFETPVYDVLSYNLTSLHDACRVFVKNDSTIYVAFNQIGNWWSYDGQGAHSYENAEYSVAVRKRRNDYILTLKHPWSHYVILNEIDGNWVPVKYDLGIRDYFDGRELDVLRYDEWRMRDAECNAYK